MSKHNVLTQAELDEFHMNPAFLFYLRRTIKDLGLDRKDFRVLDWGCGRGRSVAKLCELGYDAYGVDVDALPVSNGYQLFKSRGWEPEKRLVVLDSECRTRFKDKCFHFVFSDQVLEHVRDIGQTSRELGRIMAAGGIGVHRYPAQHSILEGHLRMPFVHWLPKNFLRQLAILACCSVGVHPKWKELTSEGLFKRADAYYQYSLHRTFYRSCPDVREIFESAGFAVSFASTERIALNERRWLKSLAKYGPTERLIAWGLRRFRHVELLTERV